MTASQLESSCLMLKIRHSECCVKLITLPSTELNVTIGHASKNYWPEKKNNLTLYFQEGDSIRYLHIIINYNRIIT